MCGKKHGVAAITLALLLAGCFGGGGGGGGGGGDGDGDGGGGGGDTTTPPPPPPPAAATTSTKTVSGSVILSALGTGAAAKSAEATTAAAPTSATITILSYEKDGTLTETRQVLAGEQGVFSTQLTLHTAAVGGGYIVIDVKSPNTSGWSKRINYDDPADIDVNAELRMAQTIVQNLDSPFKAGAENGVFKFGVVRYADGSRKTVAGAAAVAAAKASDGAAGMDMEIDIPADELPGTETLKANLLTFDPSNPDDARSFPGAYMDSTGNPLVSVAFDSIEITDDAGASVAELAAAALEEGTASKANATGVTVRRWIPSGTCESVNDFWNETGPSGMANGNSIPIYTYNPVKGIWDLLGSGTVQVSEYDIDTGTYVYADVEAFVQADCETGTHYLNIAISSEDYINAWWNLDYPLLTSQPTEVCVDLTFEDDAATPNTLSGIYAELSGTGLSRVSGSSRSNGTLRLSSIVTSGSPTTATVNYYNPYDYSYQSVADVPVGSTCGTKTVTVTKPRTCTVTGTVTKGGAAVANEYVWAYSANPYAYGQTYTGSDGKFSANARCDVDMDLYIGSTKAKSFRVDGVEGTEEVTDDGSEVTLGTLAKANTTPYAYGYLSSYSAKVGVDGTASVTAYAYGWDADGAVDYPLTYTVKGGVAEMTGSMAQSDGYKSVKLTGLTEGSYPITLEVTDQAGATGTASLGSVEVSSGNRAPVISYAYASTGSSVRLNKDGSLPAFNLYGYAYDPDDDLLTSGWSCTGCLDALPAGNNINFPGGTGYSADEVLTFTYTASDENGSATRDVLVTVQPAGNSTPYFTNVSQSASNVNSLPATVNFTAEAADADVGDTLYYTWYVNGVEDTSAFGSSYALDIPAEAEDGSSYTVRVEVTDGFIATPISRQFTVTYANTAPTFTSLSQSTTSVNTVPATVDFTATATDADGDALTHIWSVNGVVDGAAGGSSYALNIPAEAEDGSSYAVTVEVTDGRATINHGFSVVTYATVSSDTTVILQ